MSDTGGRLTLWGVEVFLAAAEEGSVSAAARRLGASPSAISQQITNLETVLGAELLNRSNRPMTLTPAGRMLRTRAQVIQSEAARARSEIAGLDLTRLGQLRLGMVEDFEASVTPTLIADMADSLSKTQFELQTGPSHRLLDKLEHRALDVVVAADLGPPAAWMDVRPLLRDPFVMVVPKGHGATLEALAALPYIEYTSRHAMGRALSAHLSEQGMRTPRRFELDSYRAMLAMVAGGDRMDNSHGFGGATRGALRVRDRCASLARGAAVASIIAFCPYRRDAGYGRGHRCASASVDPDPGGRTRAADMAVACRSDRLTAP